MTPILQYLIREIFLVAVLFLKNEVAYASAVCSPGDKDSASSGIWKLYPSTSSRIQMIELYVQKKEHLFAGEMRIFKQKNSVPVKIKVQPCEGDCCNGFYNEEFTLNFWSKSHSMIGKPGRITLAGKVDWSTEEIEGEIYNADFVKVVKFKGKKI